MEQQEQQIALLRERVLRLEGGGDDAGTARVSMGNSSVDDFSIKVSLAVSMGRWNLTL
jgi:hypothetical protein